MVKGITLNVSVVVHKPVEDPKRDAEKALEVPMQQPEVDADDTNMIGSSEG